MLDRQESSHCVRVMRHRPGDVVSVVDGVGSRYRCRITEADPDGVSFEVLSVEEGFGSHPYRLRMAVAPPKNMERFEWFAEKATEMGIDRITPLLCDYSERKVLKIERLERLAVSAAKQSHKGAVPQIDPLTGFDAFLASLPDDSLRFIACCDDVAPFGASKEPLALLLRQNTGVTAAKGGLAPASGRPGAPEILEPPECRISSGGAEAYPAEPPLSASIPAEPPLITIMIGPEGDFSRREIEAALARGWKPVSLGESRLRIETAALTAVAAVYLEYSM